MSVTSLSVEENNLRDLRDVALQYGIEEITRTKKLDGGLVNISYMAETPNGDFIIQRLSPIWNEGVIKDYCAVQSYLRTRGLFVPYLIHTLTGNPFALKNNSLWRAFENIPNDNVMESSPQTAFEAAKTLGKFHSLMQKSRFTPSFVLEGFHDTPFIIEKLRSLSQDSQYREKSDQERATIDFLLSETPKYYDIMNGYRTIIHGDPKMANFLFRDDKVVATLDLDTMMHSSPYVDLGDGFRSWCRKKPSTSVFKREIFDAGIEGYNCGNLDYKVTPEKVKKAMSLITLELAARYMNDYFEQNYFTLSPKYPNRGVQGITRAKRLSDYYRNFMNS